MAHLSVSGERNLDQVLTDLSKSGVVWITDYPDMTVAYDQGRKALWHKLEKWREKNNSKSD